MMRQDEQPIRRFLDELEARISGGEDEQVNLLLIPHRSGDDPEADTSSFPREEFFRTRGANGLQCVGYRVLRPDPPRLLTTSPRTP